MQKTAANKALDELVDQQLQNGVKRFEEPTLQAYVNAQKERLLQRYLAPGTIPQAVRLASFVGIGAFEEAPLEQRLMQLAQEDSYAAITFVNEIYAPDRKEQLVTSRLEKTHAGPEMYFLLSIAETVPMTPSPTFLKQQGEEIDTRLGQNRSTDRTAEQWMYMCAGKLAKYNDDAEAALVQLGRGALTHSQPEAFRSVFQDWLAAEKSDNAYNLVQEEMTEGMRTAFKAAYARVIKDPETAFYISHLLKHYTRKQDAEEWREISMQKHDTAMAYLGQLARRSFKEFLSFFEKDYSREYFTERSRDGKIKGLDGTLADAVSGMQKSLIESGQFSEAKELKRIFENHAENEEVRTAYKNAVRRLFGKKDYEHLKDLTALNLGLDAEFLGEVRGQLESLVAGKKDDARQLLEAFAPYAGNLLNPLVESCLSRADEKVQDHLKMEDLLYDTEATKHIRAALELIEIVPEGQSFSYSDTARSSAGSLEVDIIKLQNLAKTVLKKQEQVKMLVPPNENEHYEMLEAMTELSEQMGLSQEPGHIRDYYNAFCITTSGYREHIQGKTLSKYAVGKLLQAHHQMSRKMSGRVGIHVEEYAVLGEAIRHNAGMARTLIEEGNYPAYHGLPIAIEKKGNGWGARLHGMDAKEVTKDVVIGLAVSGGIYLLTKIF